MSDWKEGAIKRRDARHTKSSDGHKTTVPNKRNTKKWCKGKVGVAETNIVHHFVGVIPTSAKARARVLSQKPISFVT